MLTVTVNGREEKLNIGCRTFISLDVLMKLLAADNQEVTLNGEAVHSHEIGKTTVKGGDTIKFANSR